MTLNKKQKVIGSQIKSASESIGRIISKTDEITIKELGFEDTEKRAIKPKEKQMDKHNDMRFYGTSFL